MPTYTYTCTACNDMIEKRQSFTDPPLTTCEQCGGTLRKVIHPVGIVFKGSGWYITDSRASTASANGGSKSADSDSSAKPSEKSSDGASTKSDSTSTSSGTSSSSSTSSASTSTSTKDV